MSKVYLSSRGWGDYRGVEWYGDLSRPDAEIVAECQELLAKGHDVDEPNQTDAAVLATINRARRIASTEPEPAEAPDPNLCPRCGSYCYGDCEANR